MNFHQNVKLRNWEWYTILEVFAHFFIWEGADIDGPKSGLGKYLNVCGQGYLYYILYSSLTVSSFVVTLSSADNLCKQFWPRSGLTTCQA